MAMSSSSSPLSSPFISKDDKDGFSEIKSTDEEDADFFIHRARPKHRRRTILYQMFKIVVAVLAICGLVSFGMSTAARIKAASRPPCSCGSSIAEALTMGCKYDSLSTSWLPPHCRDDELTDLFEKSGPGPNGEWYYYATNVNVTKVFTLEEMALLAEKPDSERKAWATIEWHDKHCFFTLLKQARGMTKMQYTGFPSATAHAEHCAMGMTERHGAKQILVSMNPGFGDASPAKLKMLMAHSSHMS